MSRLSRVNGISGKMAVCRIRKGSAPGVIFGFRRGSDVKMSKQNCFKVNLTFRDIFIEWFCHTFWSQNSQNQWNSVFCDPKIHQILKNRRFQNFLKNLKIFPQNTVVFCSNLAFSPKYRMNGGFSDPKRKRSGSHFRVPTESLRI